MLLYTGLLFVILQWVFTLFYYIVFWKSYDSGFCESTWYCLLTTINMTFKYDSGLGNGVKSSYDPTVDYGLGLKLLRFLFDNLFNALLMIILLNIVLGIIIDTFGALREELANYTEDLSSLCFICGTDKEIIEKESTNQISFNYHIKVFL